MVVAVRLETRLKKVFLCNGAAEKPLRVILVVFTYKVEV
jgi:hypothetical protein